MTDHAGADSAAAAFAVAVAVVAVLVAFVVVFAVDVAAFAVAGGVGQVVVVLAVCALAHHWPYHSLRSFSPFLHPAACLVDVAVYVPPYSAPLLCLASPPDSSVCLAVCAVCCRYDTSPSANPFPSSFPFSPDPSCSSAAP